MENFEIKLAVGGGLTLLIGALVYYFLEKREKLKRAEVEEKPAAVKDGTRKYAWLPVFPTGLRAEGLSKSPLTLIVLTIVVCIMVSGLYSFITSEKELPRIQGGDYTFELLKCKEYNGEVFHNKGFKSYLVMEDPDSRYTLANSDIRVFCKRSDDSHEEEFVYGEDHKLYNPQTGMIFHEDLNYFHSFRFMMGKNSAHKHVPSKIFWFRHGTQEYYKELIERARANGLKKPA